MDPALATTSHDYLIVDDDEFTCQCIASLLKRAGANSIRVAANGTIAIEQLKSPAGIPGIIICDLNMPETDGVEYMMHLAKKNFAGGIILISGSPGKLLDSVMRLAKAHHLNVLGTLSKPINADQLMGLLAKFTGSAA